MKLVHLFLLPVLFLLFAAPISAKSNLSFPQARKMLHERSDSLKAASANVESKKEAADSLKWLHGPTISVQAMELWGQTHIDVDRSIATPLGHMPVRIDEDYNFSGPRASITGTLPIFTGGKIPAAQKTAKYATEEAQAQARNTSVLLDTDLIAKYFGLQLAKSIAELRVATLEQENLELNRAIKFEKQGMISEVERMGVQVARDEAERQSLKARDDARIAKLQLERLLRENSISSLSTPLFVLKKPLTDIKSWVDRALNSNPQISVIEARIRQAEQGVEAAKSTFFPQIFAFGQYTFIRHYQTPIEPTMMAGVGVNLDIWDAKDRVATYKSAKATSREARATRADIVNKVRTAVETAWLNTQNAREQYNLTASNVSLAQDNLRLKREGFGEGLFTSLDVTQARDQLLKAEVGRRVAAFEFVVNYALLHAICGEMDSFMNAFTKKEVILEK